MRARWSRPPDRGSAVVDFVLVGALVVLLFLAVIQLGLALHVRTILIDSAAEGARLASRADRGPADGVDRARDLIETAVSPRYAQSVQSGYRDVDGLRTVEVTVEAPLPVVGLLGPGGSLTVTGRALAEEP